MEIVSNIYASDKAIMLHRQLILLPQIQICTTIHITDLDTYKVQTCGIAAEIR